MPVDIAATASSTFTDTDADGVADPGEVLHHTILVTNNGDTGALDVAVTDPLNGSTIVPGSVEITPIGVDDAFTITGNTPITFTAAQLLGNDIDPDGPEASLVITDVSAGSNGTVVNNGDGTYTFTPTTGLDVGQTATFTYTVEDEDGQSNVAGYEGTVTLTVTDVVWYVNNEYDGSNGASDGSYLRPFTSMTALNGGNGDGSTNDDVDNAGETIFVYHNGTATQGALTLENDQDLFGDGHAFTVNGLTIGNDGFNTTLTASSGNMITLGQNNSIDGVILSGTGTAGGITGSGFGTLTVSNTVIDVAGQGLNLTNGTVAGTGFQSVDSDGGTNNVSLTNVAGTLNLGNGALSGASGASFNVSGGTVAVDYNGTISQANNAAAVNVSGNHTGSLTFDGAITATNGTGLQFSDADGSYDFNGQLTLGGGDAGLDVVGGSGGTFTFDNTSNAITNNSGGDAFTIASSNANVTWNGNITDNNGNAVNINEHDGGTVTFQNGTIGSTAGGIDVTNSNGGTVNFNGQTTLSTGGNNAVNLTGNTGGTINFNSTGNGLDITTTSGTGFNATGGGTVTVTGSGNSINSVSATALNVANTTIGASDLIFERIDAGNNTVAADPVNGIVLNTTGTSGGLTITGTDGPDAGSVPDAGSGGTIQNTTGDGILLTNTMDLFLGGITLTGNDGDGIGGSGVNGFVLDGVTISGGGTSDALDHSGINLNELTGTALAGLHATEIRNSTISNNHEFEIQITNSSGTLSDFRVTNSTISSNGATAVHGNLFNFLSTFSASMGLTVAGSTFDGNTVAGALTATGIHVDASGGTISANIGTSNFVDNNVGVSMSAATNGMLAFNIHDNTVTGSRGNAINFFTNANHTATASGTIANNTVGTQGVAGSGSVLGRGIRASNEGSGTTTLLITGNTVQSIADFDGLFVFAGVTAGTMNATITNNLFRDIPGDRGMNVQTGILGAVLNTTITGNQFINVAGTSGTVIRVAELPPVNPGTINLTQASNAALSAANNGVAVATDGGIAFGQPAPPLPLLAEGVPDAPDETPPAGDGDAGGDTPGEPVEPEVDEPEPDVPVDDGGGDAGGEPEPPVPSHPVIVDDAMLSQAELDWFVEAAIQRWTEAGATPEQVAAMSAAEFSVVDMAGVYLGTSSGSAIQIDSDAAGFGWFLDETPLDDAEFAGSGTRLTTTSGPAQHQIDLLTTILHELGHAAGLEDTYFAADRDDLMYGYAAPGERRLPADGEAADATPYVHDHAAYMLGPVNVGTLPAGTAIEIYYDSIVNSFANEVIPNPFTGQPTVTGSNFAAYLLSQTSLTIDALALGNLVFFDANGNGTFDGGDSGINGVTLSLFVDADNNGAADGAPLVTTATAGGGFYSFTGLAEGNYIVQVDAANFVGGGALAGLLATTNAGDPDDNVDNDSNGGAVDASGSTAATITLSYNSEPTPGVGNDSNATLDFGFMAINDAPTSTGLAGDVVTWTEGDPVVLLDDGGDATLADVDSANFDSGTLTVEITTGAVTAEDVLGIRHVGVGAGQIGVSGANVTFGGTTIGTFAGGTGVNPLVIFFNSFATVAAVQELLRNVTYDNTGGVAPTDGDRTVSWELVDGDGTANNGDDTLAFTSTVEVVGVDGMPVAVADGPSVDANVVTDIDVIANDTDADGGPKAVIEINGSVVSVGVPVVLASGASVTLNADGTIGYDPNGVFDYLVSPATALATGASNGSDPDSFSYTLNGGSSTTVSVTVLGVDEPGDELLGTPGVDTITGTLGNDVIRGLASGEQVAGGDGDDTIYGNNGNDTLLGGAGADDLYGSKGVDRLIGGQGADNMFGGEGNDIYQISEAGDLVFENVEEGVDRVFARVDYTLTDNVENLWLIAAARSGTGNELGNAIFGSGGDDTLSGLGGKDTLRGLDGEDTIDGGDGADLLFGGLGADILLGGADNDRLEGGLGTDTLTGGANRDVFVFRDGDTAATWVDADVVTDFNLAGHEKLRLDAMDADTIAGGNQAFAFIGNGAFTGVAGQLHYVQSGGITYVEGDTDGDSTADFVIALTGTLNLVADDFLL